MPKLVLHAIIMHKPKFKSKSRSFPNIKTLIFVFVTLFFSLPHFFGLEIRVSRAKQAESGNRFLLIIYQNPYIRII